MKLLLVAFFISALVALSVIGLTGSASASSACKTSKEKWVACNAENEVLKEEKVEGTGGESTIRTANITIDCKASALVTSYILGLPIVSGLATTTCAVAKPSGCSMSSAFEGEVSGALIGAVPGGPPEEELTGKGAGKQICRFGGSYETAQETHEVSCSGSCVGSKLKLGSENAEFTRTIVDRLASKGNWSIQLN